MPFIDELKKKASSLPLKSHDVKDWDRTVYFKPVTPHETALVKSQLADDDPAIYFVVGLVVLKALDENGKRLFKNEHAKELRRMPYQQALTELAAKMQERVTVEEAEGNSEPSQD